MGGCQKFACFGWNTFLTTNLNYTASIMEIHISWKITVTTASGPRFASIKLIITHSEYNNTHANQPNILYPNLSVAVYFLSIQCEQRRSWHVLINVLSDEHKMELNRNPSCLLRVCLTFSRWKEPTKTTFSSLWDGRRKMKEQKLFLYKRKEKKNGAAA